MFLVVEFKLDRVFIIILKMVGEIVIIVYGFYRYRVQCYGVIRIYYIGMFCFEVLLMEIKGIVNF